MIFSLCYGKFFRYYHFTIRYYTRGISKMELYFDNKGILFVCPLQKTC